MTLLPAWTDTALRVLAAVGIAGAMALVVAPLVYVRSPAHQRREFPLDQPVAFDHRHHVADDGIGCLYCHPGARRDAYAGVPAAEVCMGCHAQVWPDSVALEPVRRSYYSGEPLRWARVHELPAYVYFDHAIHVQKGVGCVTCHGRVDQMARVRQVAPLSMGWCLDCHRAPERWLRPLDRVAAMDDEPADPARGAALATRRGVRRLTHCTACHR